MKYLLKILKDFTSYLWSGWSSISSILLFFALWDFGNQLYGNLVLPSPKETIQTLFYMINEPNVKRSAKLGS